MTTEAMRAAFGAAFPKDGADLAMYENNSDYVLESIGARHRFAAFELGWQAATLAERNRCALACESLLELEEAAKSAENIRILRGTGGASELSALRHGLDVDTYNAGIKKCAKAIRKGETP